MNFPDPSPARKPLDISRFVLFGLLFLPLPLFAQDPAPPEDQPRIPPATPVDPLREATLTEELQQVAETPLPPGKEPTRPEWRETLTPVFEFIEGIAVNIVEDGAYKYRRARIRLTAEEQKTTGKSFRLMSDRAEHPDLYWGKAIALHGHLTKVQEIPAPENQEDASPWYEGQLKVWNDDETVQFITRLLPEGLPTGEKLNVPATVIGYLVPLQAKGTESVEPLLVARWVRWLKPTLDLRSLVHIRDRALRISEEEADAYYRTLLHAKLVDSKEQKEQAEEFWKERQAKLKEEKRTRPLFVDLFKSFEDDPKLYRGRPITLTGTLRKLRELAPDPENDYGIETLYEGWLFAEDSQSNPTVIIFTENSADLPEGDDLNVPAKVTGYVFKMYGYESRDKQNPLRVAPMILAESMTRLNIVEPEPIPRAWIAGTLTLLAVGVVLYLWTSHRKDKTFRETRRSKAKHEEEEEPPQFDKLDLE